MITKEMEEALQNFVTNGSDEEVKALYEQVKQDLLKSGIDIDAIDTNTANIDEAKNEHTK